MRLSSAVTRKQAAACSLCAFHELQGQEKILPKRAQHELMELICVGSEFPICQAANRLLSPLKLCGALLADLTDRAFRR